MKVELEAFDVVDIALMLHTVKVAGLGDKKFLKKIDNYVDKLKKEYTKQLTPTEMAKVSKKILKKYKVKI